MLGFNFIDSRVERHSKARPWRSTASRLWPGNPIIHQLWILETPDKCVIKTSQPQLLPRRTHLGENIQNISVKRTAKCPQFLSQQIPGGSIIYSGSNLGRSIRYLTGRYISTQSDTYQVEARVLSEWRLIQRWRKKTRCQNLEPIWRYQTSNSQKSTQNRPKFMDDPKNFRKNFLGLASSPYVTSFVSLSVSQSVCHKSSHTSHH